MRCDGSSETGKTDGVIIHQQIGKGTLEATTSDDSNYLGYNIGGMVKEVLKKGRKKAVLDI